MKKFIPFALPAAAAVVAFSLSGCEKDPDDVYRPSNPEGQPERQHPDPTPNTETGQGSGTRSDYKPSTGPGGRQESR
jgi:hypothetical protein